MNRVLVATLALFLVGCRAESIVTVGRPHLYGDDEVRKTYGRLRGNLRSLANGIQAARINEVFGVRQAVRYDLDLKGRATVDKIGPMEGMGEPATSPDLALPERYQVPADVGRTYEATLRDVVQRDEFVAGYELQYLGDTDCLSKEYVLALLRFDVSINRHVRMGDTPEFVVVAFRLYALKDVGGTVTDVTDKVRVHGLSPEYSALVAQESLVSLTIEDYQASVAGRSGTTDLAGTGRFQRQLEETFATLTETPLQFASSKADNSFAFAFGPRRRIVKRSWINPARWFGNAYKIEYELTPGTRHCWALVVLPKLSQGEKLRLRARADFRDDDLYAPDEDWHLLPGRELGPIAFADPERYMFAFDFATEDREVLNKMDKGQFQKGAPESVLDTTSLTKAVERTNFTNRFRSWVFPDVDVPESIAPVTSALVRNAAPAPLWYSVYPAGPSTLVLNVAPEVASAEAEVSIGPIKVPAANVEVLGRHLLRVTVPASTELESMRKQKELEVLGQLVMPGHDPWVFRVELRSAGSTPSLSTSIEPTQARAGEYVILKSNEFDFGRGYTITFNGGIPLVPVPANLSSRAGTSELVLQVPVHPQNLPPPAQPLAVKVIVDGFDGKGTALKKELTFIYRQ